MERAERPQKAEKLANCRLKAAHWEAQGLAPPPHYAKLRESVYKEDKLCVCL